jgi:hypothetical protein
VQPAKRTTSGASSGSTDAICRSPETRWRSASRELPVFHVASDLRLPTCALRRSRGAWRVVAADTSRHSGPAHSACLSTLPLWPGLAPLPSGWPSQPCTEESPTSPTGTGSRGASELRCQARARHSWRECRAPPRFTLYARGRTPSPGRRPPRWQRPARGRGDSARGTDGGPARCRPAQ